MAVALVALVVGAVALSACDSSDGYWNYRSLEVKGTFAPFVGDFAGDAAADVFWYAPGTGADALWIGRKGVRGAAAFTKVPLSISGRYRPIVGDFAGDPHEDVLWYAAGPGSDALWVSDGKGSFASRPLTVGGSFEDVLRLQDYQGGKDDLLWHSRDRTKPDYRWRMDDAGTGTYVADSLFVNLSEAIPVIGDWNGDGYEDVFWYGPGTWQDESWLLLPDGSITERSEKVAGYYEPVVVYAVPRDGILWWGQSSRSEAYWRPDESATFRSIPVRTVDGTGRVTTFPIGAAVVSGSRVYDGLFIGTETEGEFYDLASKGHEKDDELPLVGDYDGDGWSDLIWYAAGTAPDEIWYIEPPAGAAPSALVANPHETGAVPGGATP